MHTRKAGMCVHKESWSVWVSGGPAAPRHTHSSVPSPVCAGEGNLTAQVHRLPCGGYGGAVTARTGVTGDKGARIEPLRRLGFADRAVMTMPRRMLETCAVFGSKSVYEKRRDASRAYVFCSSCVVFFAWMLCAQFYRGQGPPGAHALRRFQERQAFSLGDRLRSAQAGRAPVSVPSCPPAAGAPAPGTPRRCGAAGRRRWCRRWGPCSGRPTTPCGAVWI